MKHYYTYILANHTDKVLYTGVTGNLLKRIWEHKNKLIDGFTKKYKVTKLVYFESFSDPNEAISAEKKIKGWVRKKKIGLIESMNPKWCDLYFEIDPSLRSG